MAATRKAKVIRDVYVGGVLKKIGEVIDLAHQQFHELRTTNFVVPHDEPEVVPVAEADAKPVEPDAKKGK